MRTTSVVVIVLLALTWLLAIWSEWQPIAQGLFPMSGRGHELDPQQIYLDGLHLDERWRTYKHFTRVRLEIGEALRQGKLSLTEAAAQVRDAALLSRPEYLEQLRDLTDGGGQRTDLDNVAHQLMDDLDEEMLDFPK